MKKVCVLITMTFLIGIVPYQHSSGYAFPAIPEKRRFDWHSAGYHRDPADNLPRYSAVAASSNSAINNPGYDSIYVMPVPSMKAAINSQNIRDAIQASATSAYPGRTLIQFQDGIYKIDQAIVVDRHHGSVTFKGSGNTTIMLEPPAENTRIFLVHGDDDTVIANRRIQDYDPAKKTIVFEPTPIAVEAKQGQSSTSSASDPLCALQADDYLRIRAPNDPLWNDTPTSTGFSDDILGQVVKIVGRNRSCTEFELQDDIDLIWEMATSAGVIPYVTRILPVAEVGIENMRIEPSANNGFRVESINFTRAVNSWVRDVEMVNAINFNIAISQSHALEIRGNYIHHAQVHGDGGQGYGVAISGQSTYCLVIDNIFQRMRHSMQVSGSASRNVFAYNYSREQYDQFGGKLGDINLHGTYPFGNLFEGNRADRIHADPHFGSNGPYNTFLRNHSFYGFLRLDWTDFSNVIANEANLLKNPKDGFDSIFDEYATTSFGTSLHHIRWKPTYEKLGYHSDVSYIYASRPGWIGSEFSWPPLGPKASPTGSETTQDIPARKRFFETILGGQPYTNRWPVEAGKYLAINSEGDWLTIFRARPGAAEIFYDNDGLFWNNDSFSHMLTGDFNGDRYDDIAVNTVGDWITVFSLWDGSLDKYYSNDRLFEGKNPTLKHMVAGDFNGDKIDDIAVNVDDDWITVFTIEGGAALQFYSNNRIFAESVFIRHMIAGDFNGDGIDEIAVNVEGSDRIAVFSPEHNMRNSTVTLYSGDDLFADNPSINHMIAGDFNGDGADEIAVNLLGSDDITVFGVKNGRLEILYSGSDLFPDNPQIKHMISGDFNGDGIDEIAVNFKAVSHKDYPSVMSVAALADGHHDWITVFNLHRGSLDVMYSNASLYPDNPSLQHMIAGDFNGDGLEDIAVISSTGWITVFNPRFGTPNIHYSSNNVVPSNGPFRHLIGGYFYDPALQPIASIEENEYRRDVIDNQLLVKAILGEETDPAKIDESDINGDGRVDALDIQMSVNKQLQVEAQE